MLYRKIRNKSRWFISIDEKQIALDRLAARSFSYAIQQTTVASISIHFSSAYLKFIILCINPSELG